MRLWLYWFETLAEATLSLSLSLSHCTLSLKRPPQRKNNKAGQSVWYFQRILHITQRAGWRCVANLMHINWTPLIKLAGIWNALREKKFSPAVVPDGVTRWHHATSRITCRPWPGEIMSFSQPECPRETTNNSTESQGGKRKKLLLDRRQWKEQEAQRITRSRLDAERSVDCLSCLMCRCWWFGARTEAVQLKSFIKFRRGKGMGFFFPFFKNPCINYYHGATCEDLRGHEGSRYFSPFFRATWLVYRT